MRHGLILLLFLPIVAPVTAAPPVADILRKLEANYEQTTDVRARVSLTQQKLKQGVKTTEMVYYRRDRDDAFLIVMSAPEAEKGNGYLREGDNFWMYRRNTRTFQHINRDESIGGSDARGDDFENRKLTEMYDGLKGKDGAEIITEELLGKIPAWKFELKAKVNDVDYPKKVMWVQKDNFLELKEEAYSSSGTLMQTAYFLKYTTVQGKFVPVKQIFIDEFEKGNKTMVEISGIATDKIDDAVFTKPYLENLSK